MNAEINEGVGRPTLKEKIYAAIPVEKRIDRFKITNPDVIETLHEFPVLTYLLGSVTDKPQGMDTRPDGVSRPYWLVTEGSAMFGLKNPEDAMRWKGIFNHMVGSAGNVYFLAEKIAHATSVEKKKLIELGYNPTSISSLDPDLLRDQKLIDHAGRRQMDEYIWHTPHDNVHPSGKSVDNTLRILKESEADQYFLHHMNEENHRFLLSHGKSGRLVDIQFSLLTYGDWTYDQKPVSLRDRFIGLHARKRADKEVLEGLEKIGETLESDLKRVFGDSIVQEMSSRAQYEWENKIRQSYAAGAGISASEIYSS